jgi:hypothetical protein
MIIADAIQKIIDLGKIELIPVDGANYYKGPSLARLKKPEENIPKALTFTTLTGLSDYIAANPDALDLPRLFLHVVDFSRVDLMGPLQPFNDNARFIYATAVSSAARDGFQFDKWMNLEDFIIRLQADFARYPEAPDDTEAIIELLGKVANENLKTNTDNGFTQTIQIRSGLTTLSGVRVENPVKVRPWRTFAEIEQPAITAILRFKPTGDGMPTAALFESGGGAWKLEAIKRLGTWLRENVEELDVLM